MDKQSITIIGGGPSGLIAAEILATHGFKVSIHERKPSVGRKFLMAGRGGLNLTHSENLSSFKTKYNQEAQKFLSPLLDQFSPDDLRNWCHDLGEKTFIGSSGRVFPKTFKASPLLRSWIRKLESLGVEFKIQRNWIGLDENKNLVFLNSSGEKEIVSASITLLALGGASWPNLGSDGSWVSILEQKGIYIEKLRPANCGFHVEWSNIFRSKFSGQPVKNISLSFENCIVHGEVMISSHGIEGGAVYALSSLLRNSLDRKQETVLKLDLKPSMTIEAIIKKLNQTPRRKSSFSSYLQKILSLSALEINLLREINLDVQNLTDPELAQLIKTVPLKLLSPFSLGKAISSAGGIDLECIDENMMLKKIPGIFVAGEMLDWEAPTGGYLLQANFATGVAAAKGIINYAKRD